MRYISGVIRSQARSRDEERRGLCYDTPSVEAMPFPVDMPDKTPCALSEDFYQEKLPYKQLTQAVYAEHFLSIGISPGKKSG